MILELDASQIENRCTGCLSHIIARGIDRQRIFTDDADRDNFLDRLGNILSETQTACFAWALIPNHFHLWGKS